MKKNIIRSLAVLVVALIISGCSESFLSDPKPTQGITESVVFGSREGADSYMAGIVYGQRWVWGTIYSANLSSVYFARTIKGNDFIQSNNWYRQDYEHQFRLMNTVRSSFTWNYFYYMIGQLNVFINGVENSTAIGESDKRQLLGQGKTLRAYYYFELALEYQHTYLKDPDASAPPIYTEITTEGKPMSTMSEMHDFILEDLTYAVNNLDESRYYKSFVNINVAHGILARVYQVMGNWPLAEENANAAYGGVVEDALSPESYGDGFDDASNPEWIWGCIQREDQSSEWYISPSTTSDFINGWYKATYVNDNFVSLFSDTDVRKLFYDPYGSVNWQKWATTKFTFGFESAMVLMRTAEMILIEAEAKYWQEDEEGAQDLLYALQVNRDPDAVKANNTGEALLEEILVERRKELYGEIGVEWFDAKRLRRGINRDALHRIVVTLEPDDIRFVLQIPESEILANPNIDYDVNDER